METSEGWSNNNILILRLIKQNITVNPVSNLSAIKGMIKTLYISNLFRYEVQGVHCDIR